MIERRDVFQAIADPTRRMILSKLAHGPLNRAGIIEDFDISRQAIAKHIKVLNECGMVTITQKRREQLCEARLGQPDEVVDWVTESRKEWHQRLRNWTNSLILQNRIKLLKAYKKISRMKCFGN